MSKYAKDEIVMITITGKILQNTASGAIVNVHGVDVPVLDSQISKVTREPLTYARFLDCLDKYRERGERPTHASLNGVTLSRLFSSIEFKGVTKGKVGSGMQIHGVTMVIDDSLPDNVVNMRGSHQ